MPLSLSPSVPRLQDLAALATTNAQKLFLGTGGGTLSGDGTGQLTLKGSGTTPVRAGQGLAAGAPTGTPTAAAAGAGNLTGVYQYAYTELDANGETTLSPAGSITATANTVLVTVPASRRGLSGRNLYRTAAGGATFKLLHSFGGGNGYFQTQWSDNVLDASLGATAPVADTTLIYEVEINPGVKYFRTHPNQGANPADMTILTGDPSTGGAYCLDVYGTIFARTKPGSAYGSLKTGTAGFHYEGSWLGDVDNGAAAVSVFRVSPKGETAVLTPAMTDGGTNPLTVQTVAPTVTTASPLAVYFKLTGAGSSGFSQQAVRTDFVAGYTGTSPCYGNFVSQATASGGAAHGVYATTTGAAAQNVGLCGRAAGATNNIGIFAGLSIDPDALAVTAALVASNGATASPIFTLLSNTSQRYQMLDNGNATYGVPLVADSRISVDETSGGIVLRGAQLRVTARLSGGNNIFFGHATAANLSSIGAFSGSGAPFLGFYCYHGPTASTMRFSGGTLPAAVLTVNAAGALLFRTSAAGTADTDVTLSTVLTVGVGGDITTTGQITLADAKNIVFPTTTGVKIGTATTQKLSFFNATPVVQQAGASAAAIAAITDANSKSAVSALQNALAALGLVTAPA